MAIYHCSIKIGSRAKGQSAIAASAYRTGSKLFDNEIGEVSDYTRKSGVIFSEVSLCENAPTEYSNRETLWNAVHKIEKSKNAQLWREIEVALPAELSRDKQIETVREFVKKLTNEGMCADWALHDKGDGNPHAHIMLTMRSIMKNGKWAAKSRKVYELDENGEKIFQCVDKSGRRQYKSHKADYNDWNRKDKAEEWRAAWADCCNRQLEDKNKIDHRSYKRQGKEQMPTEHEGYVARKIAARGNKSEVVERNNLIREYNKVLQEQLETTALIEIINQEIKQINSNFIDTSKEVFQTSKGLLHWAEIKNMQEASRIINTLTEYGIGSQSDIENIIDEKFQQSVELVAQITRNQSRINEIDKIISFIGEYRKYKPINDKEKTVVFKDRYRRQHAEELKKYKAALAELKKFYSKTLPSKDKLLDEKKCLLQENKALKEQQGITAAELREIDFAQRSLNDYLEIEQTAERAAQTAKTAQKSSPQGDSVQKNGQQQEQKRGNAVLSRRQILKNARIIAEKQSSQERTQRDQQHRGGDER